MRHALNDANAGISVRKTISGSMRPCLELDHIHATVDWPYCDEPNVFEFIAGIGLSILIPSLALLSLVTL